MRTHINQRNLQQSLVHSNLIGDPRKCKPIDDYQPGKSNVFDNGCEGKWMRAITQKSEKFL